MLNPDSRRQWFVFFNNKEFGPITEDELKRRLVKNEFSSEAYVFTEGMNDWEKVDGIDVFTQNEESDLVKNSISSEPVSDVSPVDQSVSSSLMSSSSFKEKVDSQPTSGQIPAPDSYSTKSDPSAQSVVFEDKIEKLNNYSIKDSSGDFNKSSNDISEPTVNRYERVPKEKSKFGLLKLIFICLAAVAAFFGYDFYQKYTDDSSGSVGNTTKIETKEKLGAEASSMNSEIKIEKTMWEELSAVRGLNVTDGPFFALSSEYLAGERPIFVGALSSIYKVNEIKVAFYPRAEKTLMPFPKVWLLKAPVIDGYFSFGPISNSGDPLPPGEYRVSTMVEDISLGHVDLNFGKWPSDEKVKIIMEENKSKLQAKANSEELALRNSFSEATVLLSDLETYKKIAFIGPSKFSQWSLFEKEWIEKVTPLLKEQSQVLLKPNFYSETQSLFYDFLTEILNYKENLFLLSKGGRKMLLEKKSLQPSDVQGEVLNLKKQIEEELVTIKTSSPNTPKFTSENIEQLLNSI